MTKARAAILLLLLMSSMLSVLWGFALERSARGIIVDLKVVYLGTRCLLEHRDPYNENDLKAVYQAEGGENSSNPVALTEVPRVVLQLYFPTTYFCIAPFALLPWSVAQLFWTGFTVATFTLAAFLIWTLAQAYASNVAFYLIAFLLANCGILFAGGNPAGLAIALCVVAVWCFLKNQYVLAGIFCLALSLELKPHDTGLIWLYFFLAGGTHRKRALQTLALTAVLALPAILWIFHVSPHWMQELAANLSATSARGEVNDPGSSSLGRSGGGLIIDLQTVIGAFCDDPRVFNPVTYLVCGPLLFGWMIVTVRARATLLKDYLGLAAIAPLTMLPVYHRPHDAKLLLLTIPVCAMLVAEGGLPGRIGLLLNSLAILITSDLPLGMLAILTKDLQLSTGSPPSKMMTIFFARPIPIVLLALGSFYLWLYKRLCLDKSGAGDTPDDSRFLKSGHAVSS